jgi:hypothetical protein
MGGDKNSGLCSAEDKLESLSSTAFGKRHTHGPPTAGGPPTRFLPVAVADKAVETSGFKALKTLF